MPSDTTHAGRTTTAEKVDFDADAYQAEIEKRPFFFKFDKVRYELPWTIDVFVADLFQKGMLLEAFEQMLGDEQWARLRASNRVLDVATLKGIFEAYVDSTGLGDLPNSPASGDSSPSTPTPSKPTFNGSTASD